MRKMLTSILVATALLAGVVTDVLAQQKPPARGIVNITGQLYRAQNDNHYTVFLVTPEGVIMSDPINRDFARWLKAEIATRHKVPVRYVLYTHKDWDHASGGVVFADTATFVGHANMRAGVALPGGTPPLPSDAMKMDANRNQLIERSEATGATAERFDLFDFNRDGILTPNELIRGPVNDVHLPSVTFRDRHTVTLGGKRVIMVPLGIAHTDDSTVLYFPDERTVFSADVMQVRRLPQAITPSVGAYIDALRTIQSLDYDHAATGHAMMGTKKDVAQSLQYLEDLSTGVAAGIGAGRSLADIQKTLTLDAYKGFERWDTHRTVHIAQVYELLKGAPRSGATPTN
jgi:glyoxylase-like metal-dependent hydrolase (beta-lactamase superfamily II)